MAAAQKVLVATVPFEAEVDGKPYLIRAGEYVRASHPVVKGRESLFDAPKDVDHEAKPKRRRRCSDPPKMPAKRPKAPKTAQKGYGPPHEKLRASLWDLGNADCDRREYTGPPPSTAAATRQPWAGHPPPRSGNERIRSSADEPRCPTRPSGSRQKLEARSPQPYN